MEVKVPDGGWGVEDGKHGGGGGGGEGTGWELRHSQWSRNHVGHIKCAVCYHLTHEVDGWC